MNIAEQMLEMSRLRSRFDRHALSECVQAAIDCAEACTACADACLAEEMVAELRRCITLNLDCADICHATAAVMSRQGESEPIVVRAAIEACALASATCAEECIRHADVHEHCRVCAEACLRCAEACRVLLEEPSLDASMS